MAAMLTFLLCSFLVAANFFQHSTDETYDRISEANDLIIKTLAYVIVCLAITLVLMFSAILIVLGVCSICDVSHLTLLSGIRWAKGVLLRTLD
jgi:hypothetical protein